LHHDWIERRELFSVHCEIIECAIVFYHVLWTIGSTTPALDTENTKSFLARVEMTFGLINGVESQGKERGR